MSRISSAIFLAMLVLTGAMGLKTVVTAHGDSSVLMANGTAPVPPLPPTLAKNGTAPVPPLPPTLAKNGTAPVPPLPPTLAKNGTAPVPPLPPMIAANGTASSNALVR
jgi:hypothetical protein